MKKIVLVILSLGALAFVDSTHAASFGAGNIVVLRLGDSGGAMTNGGVITFFDEYTTNGTFVQSVLCPTNWSYPGGVTNWPVCNRAPGNTPYTTSEGMLHRSVDGQYLFMMGYGTNGASLPLNVDIATIRGTNSTGGFGMPRVVARCDWNGSFDTSTALTNTYSGAGNYPRGAISTEGRTLWLAGQGVAARTCDLGDTYAISLNGATSGGHPNPVNNVRDVDIYDYQLYASLGGSSLDFTHVYGVYETGLPTGGDKASTNLPGVFTGTGPSPHGFVMLNVTNTVPELNVLYVTDDNTGGGGGIYKFCLTNGFWGNFGTVKDPTTSIDTSGSRIDGLAGTTDGNGNVVLYFTVNGGFPGSYLYKFVDTNGVAAESTGPITELASTPSVSVYGTNVVWKGVAFAPTSNAAPPSASFAASPTTGAAPLFVTLYFTNTVGAITNVFWDFGDASNPNYMDDPTQTNRMVHNVTHYYAPGTYTVTNIVSGPLGSSNQVAVNYIVVTNPPAPVADFNFSYIWNQFTFWYTNGPSGSLATNSCAVTNGIIPFAGGISIITNCPGTVVAPATVVFTNVSFGGYTNQFWDFGDGGTTNITPNPPPAISNSSYTVSYVYPYAGTYTVTLTVRNYSGIDDTQRVNVVTVTGGSPPGPPVAAFDVSTTNGPPPLGVTFWDNSTGYVTNRFWDFGDGNSTNITVLTSGSFSHQYATAGVFTAALTVTGNGTGNTTTNITVTSTNLPPSDPYGTWGSGYGLSGGNAAGTADPDGDGMSNTNEFLAGFNPTNSAARLRVISIARSGGDVNVTYLGANGDSSGSPGPKTNVLEFTTGAGNGSYSNNFSSTGLTNELSGGSGSGIVTNMIDVGGATGPTRYYRVRVLTP